jgi:hypothetical protein
MLLIDLHKEALQQILSCLPQNSVLFYCCVSMRKLKLGNQKRRLTTHSAQASLLKELKLRVGGDLNFDSPPLLNLVRISNKVDIETLKKWISSQSIGIDSGGFYARFKHYGASCFERYDRVRVRLWDHVYCSGRFSLMLVEPEHYLGMKGDYTL